MKKSRGIVKYDRLLLGIMQIPRNHDMLLLYRHRKLIQLKLL